MTDLAILLIVLGLFTSIMLAIRLIDKLAKLQAQVKDLSYRLNVAKDALRYAKPVVGAACAASTNDNREARKKVYERIERALQ